MEDKSNGNPLLHIAIFIFFLKNFPMIMQNNSLLFFLSPVRISRIMNAKNNFEIQEGTIVDVTLCFALLNLSILSLIAALSSSQHTLASLWFYIHKHTKIQVWYNKLS